MCDVTTHDVCKTANTSSAQIVLLSIWLEPTMNASAGVLCHCSLKIPLRLNRRIKYMTSSKISHVSEKKREHGKNSRHMRIERFKMWGIDEMKSSMSVGGGTEGPCMMDNGDMEAWRVKCCGGKNPFKILVLEIILYARPKRPSCYFLHVPECLSLALLTCLDLSSYGCSVAAAVSWREPLTVFTSLRQYQMFSAVLLRYFWEELNFAVSSWRISSHLKHRKWPLSACFSLKKLKHFELSEAKLNTSVCSSRLANASSKKSMKLYNFRTGSISVFLNAGIAAWLNWHIYCRNGKPGYWDTCFFLCFWDPIMQYIYIYIF